MASVNKVLLLGNLGSDPEIRYAANGDAFGNFRIATTDRYKDKSSGEMKESTEWHTCAVSGRNAEIASEYLKKGSSVFIEGSLRTRKWQAQDGTDRYSTEIRVHHFQMLGRRGDSGEGGESGSRETRSSEGNRPAPARQPSGDFIDDDLPF